MESQVRNRIGIVGIAVAVVAVSCGGAEPTDKPTTTAAEEPVTTVTTTIGTTEPESAAQSPDTEPVSESGLPTDLIAPGAVFLREGSTGTKFFSSAASFDETVAYYEGVLGEEPVNVGGAVGYRVASFLADTPVEVLVGVEEGSDELLIYVKLTG